MSKKEKIKWFGDTSSKNIITVASPGVFDILYPNSDFVIVREVPFLGARFVLAKLKLNNELIKKNRLKDGKNTEYYDLINDENLSNEYMSVLKHRGISLTARCGLKIQFPGCIHYHILKEGKINRKEHSVINHENLKINFTTSYTYHLIDPIKFLKVYLNRQNLRPNDDVWEVMQDDISVILNKHLISHIIECDCLELNKYYASRRFEEVLLPARAEIFYEYGLYIDDLIIEKFNIPEKISDASALMSAETMRKTLQQELAHLEAEIAAIAAKGAADVERTKLLEDIEKVGGIENYERIMRANNLTTFININGNNDNHGPNNTPPKNDIPPKNNAPKKKGNITMTKFENWYTEEELEQKNTKDMIRELNVRAICDIGGFLSGYARDYLKYKTNELYLNAHQLSINEYKLLINHFDELDKLPDDKALSIMDDIIYKSKVI